MGMRQLVTWQASRVRKQRGVKAGLGSLSPFDSVSCPPSIEEAVFPFSDLPGDMLTIIHQVDSLELPHAVCLGLGFSEISNVGSIQRVNNFGPGRSFKHVSM